jgi:hypothetical protein
MSQRRNLLLSLLCGACLALAGITTTGCVTTKKHAKHEKHEKHEKVAKRRGHGTPKYFGLYKNRQLNKRLLRRGEHEMYSAAFDEY